MWALVASLALVIGLVPLPMVLGGIGLVLAFALPLLHPVFGVLLAVLSVPVQELVELPGGMSYTQAAVLLMVAAWGLSILARPERRIETGGRLVWLWGGLLLALLLSAALTPFSRAEGLRETARWVVAFLVWLVAVDSLRSRWQVWGLVACLLAAPAACAAIGLAQFVSGDGPPAFRIAQDLPFVRAYGTIGQPNSFAGYLNMAWPLALALALGATFWRRPTRRVAREPGREGHELHEFARMRVNSWNSWLFSGWRRLLVAASLWAISGVLVAGLAASFSRGAWLGAVCGLLAMGLALGRRMALATGAVIAAGVLVLALGGTGMLPAPLAGRVASIGASLRLFDAGTAAVTPANFAAVERMAQIQAGWRMFRLRPLTGVGPGNFSVVYPEVAVGTWYASRGHAHNVYLHIAAEAGLVGLLAYLALIGGVVTQAVIAVRRTIGTELYPIAVGCCGMIGAVAGHNLFENLHVLNFGIQLAGVWAVLAALAGDVERWAFRR
jgi:hypothetical protein